MSNPAPHNQAPTVTDTERRLLALLDAQGGIGSAEDMYASDTVFFGLADRGLVEAIGEGLYQITPVGKRAAGVA
jgi:hypothetical protein